MTSKTCQKTEKTLKKRKTFTDFATKDNNILSFYCFTVRFAQKTHVNMEKEKFELFYRLLEEEKVYMVPGVTFVKICGWIGADAGEMDSYIESELGYSGDGILEAYREGHEKRLEDKYGIEL